MPWSESNPGIVSTILLPGRNARSPRKERLPDVGLDSLENTEG